MDESPLSQAQDNAPFRDIWQEGKEGAPLQRLESISAIASSSSSLAVTVPVHSSVHRQAKSVSEEVSSRPNGENSSAHHMMQLTWDPSQNWQSTPSVVSFNQVSPPITISTRHHKELMPQSTAGAAVESMERLKISPPDGTSDLSQSTSAKAPPDEQGK